MQQERQKSNRQKKIIWSLLMVLLASGIMSWLFLIITYPIVAQSSLQSIPEITAITKNDRIIVVSPHPDDEALGAAGLIARAQSVGAQVTIIMATDGNKHGLKLTRYLETETAMQSLGIPKQNLLFLGYPDGDLNSHISDFTQQLTTLFTQIQPTIVLGTYRNDVHADHAVVGRVIQIVAHNQTPQPKVYEFLIHYHRYPRPEGYNPEAYLVPPGKFLTTNITWQKLSLSSGEEQAKSHAIFDYTSQLSYKNPLLRGLLLSFIRKNELFVVVQP